MSRGLAGSNIPVLPALLLSVALAGCAGLSPRAADANVLQAWSGRFALTISAPEAAEQRQSGSFSLTERRNVTELELSNPLGVTLASARIEASGATLVTADGKRFEADSAEELTEKLFGWRIPIQRLPAWFSGKPARITGFQTEPDRPSRLEQPEQPEPRARPKTGEEDGWLIRYDLWKDDRLARIQIDFPDRVSLRMVLNDH